MLEDPTQCFLNMRCEMKEDASRLALYPLIRQVNNCNLQSHFKVFEPEQQRKEQKLQQQQQLKIPFH